MGQGSNAGDGDARAQELCSKQVLSHTHASSSSHVEQAVPPCHFSKPWTVTITPWAHICSDDAALVIAQQPGALAALKAMACHGAPPRLRNVAIGALNTLSRCPRALTYLHAANVLRETLLPALREVGPEGAAGHGATAELRQLTLACAIVNLAVPIFPYRRVAVPTCRGRWLW